MTQRQAMYLWNLLWHTEPSFRMVDYASDGNVGFIHERALDSADPEEGKLEQKFNHVCIARRRAVVAFLHRWADALEGDE